MIPQHRLVSLAVALAALSTVTLQAQSLTQHVLIRSSKPYSSLVNEVHARGGVVTHEFNHVDAIAAQVPDSAMSSLRAMLPAGAISKDFIVPSPVVEERIDRGLASSGEENNIVADSVETLSDDDLAAYASATPNAYLINNALMNVSPLHAGGTNGLGVIVAVIDSGIRPGFLHLTGDGSVIGGADFVGDGLGFSNFANGGHGTFVAGMISANVAFILSATSSLRNAILAECPSCFNNAPTNTRVPMIGTAPRASIYALRVFGPTGGAPTSRILAAIDRVIELREKFDAGVAGGVNIQVCNMSLGGSTLFPGYDLFDTSVDVLLAKGIVPVIAASNNGPSSLTIGSPGSALSAITVGAASAAHNERILRRTQFGPTAGALYRPFLGTQTAYFSSRGPNSDGRSDPDVVANGFACYGQGTGSTVNTISLGSGTSYAAPSVAGVAALLRQKYPNATARQIRNAIIMSASPALVHDGSTELDRGAGFVNALGAADLLATGAAPDTAPAGGNPTPNVKVNIEQGTSLTVVEGEVEQVFTNLQPAQRHDILYRISPNTSQVIVTLSGVTPELPAAQQNQLFGDDVLLAIHSAKTSSIGSDGDYAHFVVTKGGTFVIDEPELGIMRITVNGDWTNAGKISGNVKIVSVKDPVTRFTQQGKIVNGQTLVIPVEVPAGVESLNFRLGWREDWASFPGNDLDLVLIAPNGTVNGSGATSSNPEKVTIAKPLAGKWVAMIDGFDVATGDDKYEFRVTIDGQVLK
jgi:subtilisin family serine protease